MLEKIFDVDYEIKENNFYKKSLKRKCYDINNKTNYIYIDIIYCHFEYSINIFGMKREDNIWTLSNAKTFKIDNVVKNTSRLSKKKIEEIENFIYYNKQNIFDIFEKMNDGIKIYL